MRKINRLKIVLVEQNKTGKWLAETLGKNEAQPSLDTLVMIANALKIDVKDLLVSTKR
jgi:hypothetical protein